MAKGFQTGSNVDKKQKGQHLLLQCEQADIMYEMKSIGCSIVDLQFDITLSLIHGGCDMNEKKKKKE